MSVRRIASSFIVSHNAKIHYKTYFSSLEKPLSHVILAHPTGFCKEIWDSVVEEFDKFEGSLNYSFTAIDARGHGDSWQAGFDSWWDTSNDFLNVTKEIQENPYIGVGLSMGGTCLLIAQLQMKNLFKHLILLEPILVSPGLEGGPILADMALSRRANFSSKDEAFQYWKNKRLFKNVDERALKSYVNGGLRKTEDDNYSSLNFFVNILDGYTLKCKPESEAKTFRNGYNGKTEETQVWQRLNEINCPTDIMFGEKSQTFIKGGIFDPYNIAEQFSNNLAKVTQVNDSDHLIAMEQPEFVARKIYETLHLNTVNPKL